MPRVLYGVFDHFGENSERLMTIMATLRGGKLNYDSVRISLMSNEVSSFPCIPRASECYSRLSYGCLRVSFEVKVELRVYAHASGRLGALVP